MPLRTGQALQRRYRIVSLLGQGGMGAVYRAWDTRLNVAVALKEMIPQPGLDTHALRQLRRQFQQEAQVLARLSHAHLVRVTDFFEEGDNAYLVMDFVEGESLAERIGRQGALQEKAVLAWATQLLDALAYCHSRGIIHRDIKPQNVIIRPDEQAVLVDFGLVKLWDPGDPRTRTAMRGMGTPEYAPPEQYDTESAHTDARTDVYGLGATMYHALVGQAPPTATQRIARRDSFQPPRVRNPRISLATERAVLRSMALAVDERFQTAAEMRAALTGGAPASARPAPAKRGPTRPVTGPGPAAPRRRKPIPVWVWALGGFALLALAVLMIGIFGLALLGQRGPGLPVTVPATSTRASAATSTPPSTPMPTPTPMAPPPPVAGKIVFVSDRDSGEDIYVAPADGSRSPMRLSDSGLDYAPYWSSNTGGIVFASRRTGTVDIYTMNASGGQVQQRIDLDPGLDRPLLAPTGDKVAFLLDNDVGWGTLASGDIRLADTGWVRGFAWSPDGKSIATIDDVVQGSGEPRKVVIQVIDTDLTDITPRTIFERAGSWKSESLAWSPDGKWLAFPLAPDDPYTELGIYLVDTDGSGLHALADVEDAEDAYPVWSPDGSQLLFVSTSDNKENDSIDNCDRSVIYRVSADGSNLTRLTQDGVESYDPVWSPDGRRIAYVVFEDGSNEIYVMNADGSNNVRLTVPQDHADEYHPSWSPDGTQVIFASSRYAPHLYLLDPATGVIQQVASDSPLVVHSDPRLTADGTNLAFAREYSFSSREKRLLGGNGGVCSSEGVVIISEPKQAAGGEVPAADDLPNTRALGNWSSDGRWLLYEAWNRVGTRLWDTQVGEYVELEGVPDHASRYATLSPSGEQVAYYDYEDDQVYLVSVASGSVSNLSGGAAAYAYAGALFSPDGRAVLFEVEDGLQVRDLTGALLNDIRPDLYESHVGVGVYVEQNEGGEIELRPFSYGPAAEAGILEGDVLVAVDGVRHAPGMDADDFTSLVKGGIGTDVTLTIRRPGVAEELTFVITRMLVRLDSPTGTIDEYAWLPDGSRFTYEISFPDADRSTLWTYDVQRDAAVEVATIAGGVWALSASPDGRWLVFVSDSSGNDEVYGVPVAGGAVLNLTDNPADDYSPVWIP